jgi:hypothetical protein
MKRKIVACILTTLLVAPSAFAQKVTINQAFNKLVEKCTDFSSLKGGKIPTGPANTTFSKMTVDIAKVTFFQSTMGLVMFNADFGYFPTEAAARQKVDQVSRQMTAANPKLRFASENVKASKIKVTHLIENTDTGFRLYEACFKVNTTGGKYNAYFEFPQANSVQSTYGDLPYAEFVSVTTPADAAKPAADMRQILTEAKTGFAAIKGEKMDNGGGFTRFKSTFAPEGLTNNCIEDRGLGQIFFKITLAEKLEQQATLDKLAAVRETVSNALGSDYGYHVSTNQREIAFVHKNSPFQQSALLMAEKRKDGSFNVYLLFPSTAQ